MLKVAVVAPAGTIMLAGTAATLVLLLTKRIVAPPEGAGELSVTLPAETEPPRTLVGLRVSALRVGSEGGGVRVGVGVGCDPGVGDGNGVRVGVGEDDGAPIDKVALTFEPL